MWEKATVVEGRTAHNYRMDIVWHHMSTMRASDNTFLFPRLSKITILVIANHTTLQCTKELVFSMVQKNKPAFQPSLDPKGTLSIMNESLYIHVYTYICGGEVNQSESETMLNTVFSGRNNITLQ